MVTVMGDMGTARFWMKLMFCETQGRKDSEFPT